MSGKSSVLTVQVKASELLQKLLRYQVSVHEEPERHEKRAKVEQAAIEGVFACVQEADASLVEALAYAEVLEGEGGQGKVS